MMKFRTLRLGLAAGLAFGLSAAAGWAQSSGANAFRVNQQNPPGTLSVTADCLGGKCRTSLEPTKVISLGAGNPTNTKLLAADLADQYPEYTITAFGGNLNINFNITQYFAFNDGKVGGGNLFVDFTTQPGAVLPTDLHWIQVLTDNYNLTGYNGGDLSAPKGPGAQENVIDAPNSPSGPFYDLSAAASKPAFNATPPHFEDGPDRPEPTAANPVTVWNAELFLVADTGNDNLTVYNGVEWGWTTQFSANGVFSAIPEPSTWAALMLGLFATGAALRRRGAVATA